MKNKRHKVVAIAVALSVLALLAWAQRTSAQMSLPAYTVVNIATNAMLQQAESNHSTETSKKAEVELTHRQQLWIDALEWCESRGVADAVNPKDRDGTASYGAFQFKPGTLDYYGKIYGVVAQGSTLKDQAPMLKSEATQAAIVKAMVLDSKNIDWHQQFPDCVKRLGLPPTK